MGNRKLILDTETTGLDYVEDKIIEIGIIELIDDIRTNNNFHIYINPNQKISMDAQKIHGLTNEFLDKEKMFPDIADEFLKFIGDDILIIHNSQFDLNFINKELENCGRKKIVNPIIDTINLARKKFPGQTVNLDALCRKLNIVNTRKEYHGALLDADLLCKVYLKISAGKQEMLNLSNFNNRKHVNLNSVDDIRLTDRKKLKHIDKEDLEYHDSMVNSMKDPIWKKI